MIYDLTMGESFSAAMEKQNKAFPRLLINMIKTSEMTGQLPEVLDDQVEYYTETEKTRKAMISALTYPLMVLFVAICVISFIMIWVVPQFVTIFESMDGSTIPGITLFILGISNFLKNYWYLLILFIIAICFLGWYLYKNVDVIRIFTQWVLMHTPVIGNVIIYNEVTMFTKTFAALLEHNVFITDSMEILNKITNNEIYKMLIKDTIVNLATYRNKTILNTLKTEGIYGYNDGGNSTSYKNNEKFSMEAAINALTNGKDYSNGAIRWDGFDLAAKGFNHVKAVDCGIRISETFFNSFKSAQSDDLINRYSGGKYTKFSDNFKAGDHKATGRNKGCICYEASAVEGLTMFWKKTDDPSFTGGYF